MSITLNYHLNYHLTAFLNCIALLVAQEQIDQSLCSQQMTYEEVEQWNWRARG